MRSLFLISHVSMFVLGIYDLLLCALFDLVVSFPGIWIEWISGTSNYYSAHCVFGIHFLLASWYACNFFGDLFLSGWKVYLSQLYATRNGFPWQLERWADGLVLNSVKNDSSTPVLFPETLYDFLYGFFIFLSKFFLASVRQKSLFL